ncbi:MAG: type II secretion system protein GspN [Deltaproteobacteria bacterium]|jgi:type II secretion system protein N|nr:type II secretion system protein GspN [Deltaproteobacteria bacterium]
MKKIKNWILYPGYILGITIVFLYMLFPSEAAKGYITGYLDRHYPDYQVTVGNVAPVFPPGLVLESISLAYRGDKYLDLTWLKVRPRYLSLFKSWKTLLLEGRAYSGDLKGSVDFQKGPSMYRIKTVADLSGIMLEECEPIQTLSGRKVAGVLGSAIRYSSEKGPDGKLYVDLAVADGGIGLTNPVFSISNLEFDRLDAELIVDTRSLRLKRCDVRGKQVNGSVTGIILFRKPIEKSRLEFKGNVMPQHLLLASLQKVLPKSLLPSRKAGDKGYPIKLYGTIEKPKFVLR